MNQCSRCEGFVPAGLTVCPNCRAAGGSAWWKIPLAIAGAGVATVTLSACYGPGCAATVLPDGSTTYDRGACGYDCRTALTDGGDKTKDPTWQSICLDAVDSGIPDAGGSDAGDGGSNGDH